MNYELREKCDRSKMRFFVLCLFFGFFVSGFSQDGKTLQLTLDDVISLAQDSSLTALRIKNDYLASYWEYKSYKASRLPALRLRTNPFSYNRNVIKEFNFAEEKYQYIEQKNLNSSVNLILEQSLPLTGGQFYIDSRLARLQNFGDNGSTQYSTIPIRIGYSQSLFGFNQYKWDVQIEPLKYEKSRKEYLHSNEELSINAVDYFFDVSAAQISLEIATSNLANADTLYQIAEKRFKIAAVSKAELLNFRLDVLNGKNEIENSRKQLRTAQKRLLSFLGLPDDYAIVPLLNDNIILQDVDVKKTVALAQQHSSSFLDFQKRKLEATMNIEKAKAKSRFDAQLDLSYGLNQRHEELDMAYQDLLNQQMVNITLSIPLLDWGQRKGKYKLAQKQNQAKIISVQQAEAEFNQSIMMIAEDFNLQYNKLLTAKEADEISTEAYGIVKQRFMIGEADINTLNLFQTKQIQAKKNYIAVLKSYWKYYYNIRKITLYNFENNTPLTVDFDDLILD